MALTNPELLSSSTAPPKTHDIFLDLILLQKAITRQGPFAQYPPQRIAEFIHRTAKTMMEPIQTHLRNDDVYTHWSKIRFLEQALTHLGHLARTAKYSSNWNHQIEEDLRSGIATVDHFLQEYAKTGSVYLIRHCTREIRTTLWSGKTYPGIATSAMRKEAMRVAQSIKQEALLSPKRVLVTIMHSDQKRTLLFAQIIKKGVESINQESPGKVRVDWRGEDRRLHLRYDDDSATEYNPLIKAKGEGYYMLNWLNNTNECATFKHQPNAQEVTSSILDFLHQGQRIINQQDAYYHIVIGISHAGIIDTALYRLIPDVAAHFDKFMATASYCKVECDQFGYLGKWVDFRS